jgi:hypothetical protein
VSPLDPAITARLSALADDRALTADGLDVLSPLLDALAALDRESTEHVGDLRVRLTAALGDRAGEALCDGARSAADVAARYFRLRDLVRAREAIAG